MLNTTMDKGDILRFLIETKNVYKKKTRNCVTVASSYIKFLCKRVSERISLPENEVVASCDAFNLVMENAEFDLDFKTFKIKLVELLWHRILNEVFSHCFWGIRLDSHWIGIQEWDWRTECYRSLCPRYRYSLTDPQTGANYDLDFVTNEGGRTNLTWPDKQQDEKYSIWFCDVTLLELEQSYLAFGTLGALDCLPKELISLCLSYIFTLPTLPKKELSPIITPVSDVQRRVKYGVVLMSDKH